MNLTLLPIPCSSHSEIAILNVFSKNIYNYSFKHTSDKSKVAIEFSVPKELKRKIEIIDKTQNS